MTATAAKTQPHISMIVLTYNQQAFVRKAVKSALLQDCAPIEIIVSDDCSTDDTYAILAEEIGTYEGPHKVVLNRNDRNLGLVAHINKIVRMAAGEIIIPAYGDDISAPTRVSEIARVFERQSPLLVHTDAIAIDDLGNETKSSFCKASFLRTTDALEIATSMALYLGASGAWHKHLFEKYGSLKYPEPYDDHVLGFRAALERKIAYIQQPLIYYREGIGLSHVDGVIADRTPEQIISRRKNILSREMSTFRQRLDDAKTFGLHDRHVLVRKLRKAILVARLRRDYYDGPYRLIFRNFRHPMLSVKAIISEGLRYLRKK